MRMIGFQGLDWSENGRHGEGERIEQRKLK